MAAMQGVYHTLHLIKPMPTPDPTLGSPTAALHIAQLCSAAQCQSQAWIKEEGDGKSLCFYTLSYASLCLQYKSKASTLAFDFIVAQLCSHTSVTSPVSPSSWILLSML